MNATHATTHMIPIAPNLPHPLGRHVHHDPRNLNFRALVKPPLKAAKPNQAWVTATVFDQGESPRCTCEAAVGLLTTNPYRPGFTERPLYDSPNERQALYLTAQDNDPWPGHDYDGTSTDAPFKVLKARGSISVWSWLFGEAELRKWVTWYGPAVVGTNWLMGMFNPDPKTGFLTCEGDLAGGHAYRLVQYSATRDAYRIVNSWGKAWGQAGRAWIRSTDLAHLLADQGDAVTVA